MVERQLAALVQAANANQAQIDERLRRAEAELAEVRAELRELIAQRRSRGAQVTQPPEEKQAPVQPSAEPAPTSVTEETPSTAPTAKPAAATPHLILRNWTSLEFMSHKDTINNFGHSKLIV
jgi:TolA-binding protein